METKVSRAMSGRQIAKGSPRREYVAIILSTPICGLATKKATIAPRDAHILRISIPSGNHSA